MKAKAKQRLLSIALSICMMFTLVPAAAAVGADGFTDVTAGAWYYDDVAFVVQRGYFNGTGLGRFSPNAAMTRAMFVTVLSRLDGAETDDSAAPFEDVPAGAWCAGEVDWAVRSGIVSGSGDGRFSPDQAISRQQMAAFMARYIAYYTEKNGVQFAAAETEGAFTDAASIADYAVEAVALCRSYGLIGGYADGSFGPTGTSTRAHVAAVIHRLALLLETGTPGTTPAAADTPDAASSDNTEGGGAARGDDESYTEVTTADAFVIAATKNATNVTVSIEDDNSLTKYDDLDITNNNVTNLTLDMGSAGAGDLTIMSTSARRIVIFGDSGASFTSMTINAPNATVNNHVKVNGPVDIKAVYHDSFHNDADITGSITLSGPGKLEDTQAQPSPVVIATTAKVEIQGKTASIEVSMDGANVTLDTSADVTPVINSSASGVALTMNTSKATIGGTIGTLTTGAGTPELTINGSVKELDTKASDAISLSGGGDVGTLTAAGTAVKVEASALTITEVAASHNSSISAPAGVIDTVSASGNVRLDASVNTVSAKSGASLDVSANASVRTLEAQGEVSLAGSGKVEQIDVAADRAVTLTIPADMSVSAVNNTGSAEVTLEAPGKEELKVMFKAPKPTGIKMEEPTLAGGSGKITGLDANTMEYQRSGGTWADVTGSVMELASGTYLIQVKATEQALASEPVTVVIPKAIGVDAAAIQGEAVVGQTLTATANGDATGKLSYVWMADNAVIPGASDKSFTLTDSQAGKAITVKISNYTNASWTSGATAKVTADKTGLNKLLGKAADVQQGVFERDLAASAVAEGILFVTTAEQAALNSAVTAAQRVADRDGATTSQVAEQETALRAAVNTYIAAKKVGTYNEIETLKSELSGLIGAAEAATAGVTTSADAAAVAPGTKFVSSTVKSDYEQAIAAAKTTHANGTASQLAAAITTLNSAMSTYRKAIREGTALDNTALLAAISAAELNAAGPLVCESSSDALPSETWVNGAAKSAYEDAIAAAKALEATVQNENAAALKALNDATDLFNGSKKAGTKDIIAPIITARATLTGGKTYNITLSSNEDGVYEYQIGTQDGAWTSGDSITAGVETSFAYTLSAANGTVFLRVTDGSGNVTVTMLTMGLSIENAEASIGNAAYETLAEAVAAATDGQTVRMERDVTLSGSRIIARTTITLDLGGHKLESSDTFTLVAEDASTLTVKNGRVVNTSSNGAAVYAKKASVVLEQGADIHGNYIGLMPGNSVAGSPGEYWGNATIKDGAKVYGGYDGVLVPGPYHTKDRPNGLLAGDTVRNTLTVEGGAITGYNYGIAGSGSNLGTTITITGGTILQEGGWGGALYHPQDGELYISGNPIFTGDSGIQLCSGEGVVARITGGTVTATDDDRRDEKSGDGFIPDGAALSVVDRGYPGGTPKMTVTGGTFISQKSDAVMAYAWSNSDSKASDWAKAKQYLTITGGTFSDMTGLPYMGADGVYTLGDDANGNGYSIAPGNKFTLDLGGHTYTADGFLAGSNGTKNQAFQFLKDSDITMQNGTVRLTASGGKIVVQNYANLTLKDVTLDGTTLTGTNPYVLSNNYGTVRILGNTNIVAKSETDAAFDIYYWPSNVNNYSAGVEVTVNTTGTITGRVEYAGDKTTTPESIAAHTALNWEQGALKGSVSFCEGANVRITGGSFGFEPSAYVPDGYQVTQSGETYTVSPVTTPSASSVAQVKNQYFNTLEAAFATARDKGTVTLLQDVTGNVVISDDMIVTLDLNGHDLTGALNESGKNTQHTIAVDGGNLTVKDSTAVTPPSVDGQYAVTYESGAIRNLKPTVSPYRQAVRVFNGGSFTLESGTLYSEDSDALFVGEVPGNVTDASATGLIKGGYIYGYEYAVGVISGSTLTVKGGVIVSDNNSAVAGNGSTGRGDTTINVEGGTLITHMEASDKIACGIYHPQRGTLNISGGTIYVDQGVGVEMRGGVLNMTDGSIIATGTATGKVGDSKVDVYCHGIHVDGASNYYDYENCQVNISGGSITSAPGVAAVAVTPESDVDKLTITGGVFSSDPTTFVLDGYETLSAQAPYAVTARTEESADNVAQAGQRYYATLKGALENAPDGSTVTLLDDLTVADGILFDRPNETVTLDINGKTYTVTDGSNVNNRGFKIQSGTLKVIDSNTDQPGKMVAAGSGTTSSNGTGAYGMFRVEKDGTLKLTGVALENYRPYGLNVKVCGGQAMLEDVTITSSYGGGIEVAADAAAAGSATVKNCTITQTGYFDHCSSALAVSGGSSLTVEGGAYTSDGVALYVFSSGGQITVKDGSFEGVKQAIRADADQSTYADYEGSVQIKGGRYTGGLKITAPATMTVTGGTFSADPAAYLATGYRAVSEGTCYTVEEAPAVMRSGWALAPEGKETGEENKDALPPEEGETSEEQEGQGNGDEGDGENANGEQPTEPKPETEPVEET